MFGLKNFKKILVTLVFAAALGSCGGTTNDQGTSLLLLGFFQFDEDETIDDACAELPTGLVGTSVPLGVAFGEVPGNLGGWTSGFVGLQNNLSGQFVSVDSVQYEFFIPGATAQPPSTVAALPAFIGPLGGTGDDEETYDSSLPDGFGGDSNCNRNYSEINLLPFSVRTWMSFNRNSLPEPPFDLLVTVAVSAQSSSGKRITTNEETIFVTITPETVVLPVPAGVSGSSASGVSGSLAGDAEESGNEEGATLSGDEELAEDEL